MQNIEFTTGQIRPVEIFKEAWELLKGRYWLVLGITIVGMLISGAVPVILLGPMACGIFLVMLRVIDREPLAFEHLFKGFDFIWKSLPISLFVMVPVFILLIVIYIPMVAMALAGPRMNGGELMAFLAGTLIFEFVVVVVMVCFHTLLMFAFPLVADKGLSGIDAVKLSVRAVWANLAGIAGMIGVGTLVCIAGYLLFCIGVYFAIPLVFLSQAIAYRSIFPRNLPAAHHAAVPNVFQGQS